MGVYIKGVEMPTSCNACMFDVYGLCLINKNIEGKDELTHSCPLVPVPPHGRLIDADALLADDNRKYDTYRGANGRDTLLDDVCHRTIQWEIEDAPTIIPAEEVE